MGKILLALVIGLVGAAIVHISVVLLVPVVAENDAWARLSRLGDVFQTVRIENTQPASGAADGRTPEFPFLDPAFMTVACRFSLADGPARLFATEETDFWSASIYGSNGDNLYSISERVALDGRLQLFVGSEEQLALARAEGSEPDPDSIPVTLPLTDGFLIVRALVPTESERPYVDRFMRSITCRPASIAETGKTS